MATASGLTDRLAADVDKAFPDFVAAYQDRLYSGLRAFVGSADAEDVAQEAFVRAHRALCDYEATRIEELKLGPWLWTIGLNLCRNWARSKSRRPQTVSLFDQPAAAAEVEDDALAVAALGDWRIRLARLSEAQRTAVVLRHVVGLSYAEIADATDRPVGTSKADVSRGLAALRQMIGKESAA